jgi:mannosylglycerate hydrolase
VAPESGAAPQAERAVAIDNEFLSVSANDDGTFEVTAKKTGTTWHRVASIEDSGDVGDEYNYCPPANDRRFTNAVARVVSIGRVVHGPVRSTLRVELEVALPLAADQRRSSRASETVPVRVTIDATLDRGSPRVAFTVVVDNRASDHRLRLLFPTAAARIETARADTAFDVVTRPARREVPATIVNEAPVSSAPMLSVVDAGDDRAGATVIAKGLHEYEIVQVGSTKSEASAIALTLIRAVGDLSRNDLATRPSGHAGPPVATPGAQCLGRHTFRIAFEPRSTQPPPARLLSSAREVTLPPRIVPARLPGGTAPLRRSFVRVEGDGAAVLSALKKADDRNSVIVRLFNPTNEDTDAAIRIDGAVTHAFAVNFLEERQSELAVESGGVRVHLKAHEIKTTELTLRRS